MEDSPHPAHRVDRRTRQTLAGWGGSEDARGAIYQSEMEVERDNNMIGAPLTIRIEVNFDGNCKWKGNGNVDREFRMGTELASPDWSCSWLSSEFGEW